MEDYQKRVVRERNELNRKKESLRDFIFENSRFKSLRRAEQVRMIQQLGFMEGYLSLLNDRIKAF